MKTKMYLLLLVCVYSVTASGEIVIISNEPWSPNITGSWNKAEGLSYSNTVYGDTYYNPEWQDMTEGGVTLKYATLQRYFNLRPQSKRNWSFSMPITNLNAEKGYEYYSRDDRNKKQKASQIYWGICIGYKENGKSREVNIWLKRSNAKSTYSRYEDYSSEMYIEYSIDGDVWRTSSKYYPSVLPGSSPKLLISAYESGRTTISWGGLTLTTLPVYMEELTSIIIKVGTQAKIQIGKPYAHAAGVDESKIYTASEYLEQENYAMVKQKLYRADNMYYEKQAAALALAYIALGEYDKSIEMLNALIKFNGESLAYAYYLRGAINENLGNKMAALDDYQKSGEQEEYNRLYNEIYRPVQTQAKPKSTQAKKNVKPKLTK